MINDGYIEEPRFFEHYNPLRNNYIPKFYYSFKDLNQDPSTLSHKNQTQNLRFNMVIYHQNQALRMQCHII